MYSTVVKQLERGLRVSDYILYVDTVTAGRFREETDLDLYVRNGTHKAHVLYVKIFDGRRPWYKPWIELFGIDRNITINSASIPYIDSAFERRLLTTFSSALSAGENIFVDYHNDVETKKQLAAGFPAVVTRLGSKLHSLGFTWFKDWYFPEGYMEGEQKLQAEKPLDGGSRNRHLREIRASVETFLDSARGDTRRDQYYQRAVKRAQVFIDKR